MFAIDLRQCPYAGGAALRVPAVIAAILEYIDSRAARTVGHHPCLTNHLPTFEILQPTETLGIRISYLPRKHSERYVIAVAAAIERNGARRARIARPLPDIGALSAR